MTTITTERPWTPTQADAPIRQVMALARFDAYRLLRHPLTVAGALGSLVAMWLAIGGTGPVLQRDSGYLAGAMLPLAVSTFLIGNFATMRWRQLPQLLTSIPAPSGRRLVGLLTGLLGPVVLSVVLTGVGLVYLSLGDPIGEFRWWEIAAGPLVVFAAGVVGTVLGYWLPHRVVAPLALLTLGLAQMSASPTTVTLRLGGDPNLHVEWLFPWMTPTHYVPVEVWIANRPARAHALFLLLGPGLLGAVAVLGAQRRHLLAVGLAAAGLSSVVAMSAVMPEPVTGFDWSTYYEGQQCEGREGVTYCASPLYGGWIDRWHDTVSGVDDLIPIEVDWVVQRTPWYGSTNAWANNIEAGVARTSYRWDRSGGVPVHSLALGLEVAQTSVGLPTTHPELEECWAGDQARAVAAVWLAAAPLDRSDDALDRAIDSSTFGYFRPVELRHPGGARIDTVDARVARDLLELPTARVTEILSTRWEEVQASSTTSAELAGWFGVSAPTPSGPGIDMEPCA